MDSIANIRTDYKMQTLSEADTAEDALEQFSKWWDEAVAAKIEEVNAMTLATADKEGRPSARIVLLKGVHNGGFVWYTNYESQKGNELLANDRAALVFFWKELERQVRIEGKVSRIPAAESDEYFHSRPHDSQIGAWSSPQSRVIPSREVLEENVTANKEKFAGQEMIERPPYWGGYILIPEMMEFWQGRSNRLHDRIQYVKENGSQIKRRLAP